MNCEEAGKPTRDFRVALGDPAEIFKPEASILAVLVELAFDVRPAVGTSVATSRYSRGESPEG